MFDRSKLRSAAARLLYNDDRDTRDYNLLVEFIDATFQQTTAIPASLRKHTTDRYKGLKRKFLVFKSDTGEQIENCFVLRPDRDPVAVEALRTYARETNNKELSADIFRWVGTGDPSNGGSERLKSLEAAVEMIRIRYIAADCKGVEKSILADVLRLLEEDITL